MQSSGIFGTAKGAAEIRLPFRPRAILLVEEYYIRAEVFQALDLN